jgi:hypothetical protein
MKKALFTSNAVHLRKTAACSLPESGAFLAANAAAYATGE